MGRARAIPALLFPPLRVLVIIRHFSSLRTEIAWCYFPSAGMEIYNYISLFSVLTDGTQSRFITFRPTKTLYLSFLILPVNFIKVSRPMRPNQVYGLKITFTSIGRDPMYFVEI